jgi:hypothetical protein
MGPTIALVLFVCVAAPLHAGADRTCTRGCRADQRTCVSIARASANAFRTACSGGSSARHACRRGTGTVLRSSLARCRRLRKDCRACCRAGGQGPACPVGHPFAFDPPPPLDVATSGLPPLADGNFFVLSVPGAQLEIDPTRRDPVTAAGACARWITSCVEIGGHPLDDCTRSAPPCATDRPWEEATACCPATCFERYQDARRAGTDPVAALDAVYFGKDPCFPGVAALLSGGGQ